MLTNRMYFTNFLSIFMLFNKVSMIIEKPKITCMSKFSIHLERDGNPANAFDEKAQKNGTTRHYKQKPKIFNILIIS